MSNGNEHQPENVTARLTEDESIRLTGEITGLVSAGLPLSSGLRATAAEMPRSQGRFRSALNAVADSLDGGATVDDALKTAGSPLPEHLRGIVGISARSGRTSQALGKFVSFSTLGADLRWRLWASLSYPLLSMAIASGIFVFICVALVGNFETIYKDFGVPLPRLTMVLLVVARPFYASWDVFLEGIVGLLFFGLLFLLFVNTSTRRGLIGSIPIVGPIFRNISLAEFCHLLALLVDSEIPLPEAIRLSGRGVKDSAIDRAAAAISQDVSAGTSLSAAVARRSVFPSGLSRVLKWAEGTRSLPESLRMIGEMFGSRARAQAEFAGTFLSVLAVLSILFGAAIFAIGLLLPMITLITKLSG